MDEEDLKALAKLGVTRNVDSDIRLTDTFGCMRRRGLLDYLGKYLYKVTKNLKAVLDDCRGAGEQLELDFSSEDGSYLYVTIKVSRQKWLENLVGAKPRYFIGKVEVNEEQYSSFLENNKGNTGLIVLAREVSPKFPLWTPGVPILKVSETID